MMRYMLIFLGLSIFGLMVSRAHADLKLDGLIAALDASENAVTDLLIEYEMRIEYADIAAKTQEANEAGHGFLLSKGPIQTELQVMKPFSEFYRKRSITVVGNAKGLTGKDDRIVTYNGKCGKTYKVAEIIGQPGKEYCTGLVGLNPTESLRINVTPVGYIAGFRLEVFDGRIVNLPEYLRLTQESSKTDRLVLNTEALKVNDCNAVSIWHWRRLRRNDNGEEIDWLIAKYFFSTDHNLSLVRYEVMRDGEIGWRKDIFGFEMLSNGIWFPVECAFRDFAPDGTANIFKVTKIAVNQGLTEKDFDMTFPPGTRVEDRITGRTYVVKPTQEQLDESLPKK